jgi:hypothetical protein
VYKRSTFKRQFTNVLWGAAIDLQGSDKLPWSRQIHDTSDTSYISSGEHLQDQGTQKNTLEC